MTTHYAWDSGAIQNAMALIVHATQIQKTTKTYCGVRVTSKAIDNIAPTCAECQAKVAHNKALLAQLLAGEL